jgi:hypothetical protein
VSDWYDYIAKKVAPKPSYQRPMPVQRREPPAPEPESQGMTVEESTASDSMIMRIIGKIRGG